MAKNKIIDLTESFMDEYMKLDEGKDLFLYHLEYVKEGPDKVLRVYIDKEEGYISTQDCENVSRFLSDKLDSADPIEENYVLEVSSPGLDRVLITEEHFKRYLGEEIEVSIYKEIDGSKKIEGTLLGYKDGRITILMNSPDEDQKEIELDSKEYAKVNLAVVI